MKITRQTVIAGQWCCSTLAKNVEKTYYTVHFDDDSLEDKVGWAEWMELVAVEESNIKFCPYCRERLEVEGGRIVSLIPYSSELGQRVNKLAQERDCGCKDRATFCPYCGDELPTKPAARALHIGDENA